MKSLKYYFSRVSVYMGALESAAQKGRADKCAKFIQSKACGQVELDRSLVQAAGAGETGIMKMLLEAGANKDAIEYGNRVSPLECAIERSQPSSVRFLIDAGVDVDINGGAAVYLAAVNGKVEILKMLLAANANVNAGSGRAIFCSAHRLCFPYKSEGRKNVETAIELLLAAGANPKDRDRGFSEGRRRANEESPQSCSDVCFPPAF